MYDFNEDYCNEYRAVTEEELLRYIYASSSQGFPAMTEEEANESLLQEEPRDPHTYCNSYPQFGGNLEFDGIPLDALLNDSTKGCLIFN